MANMNEIFENLGKTFGRTADMVVKKTDEIISVQKVRSRKNTLEHQMNAAYQSIGKRIFSEYKEGRPLPEDIAKLCEKIKKLQKEIDACTSEIADIKGQKVCDSCGNPIPEEADYCMKCGNPKPEEEDIEDADFEAAEFDEKPDDEEESEEEDEAEEADAEASEAPGEAEEEPSEDAEEPESADGEEAEPETEVPEEEPEAESDRKEE